MNTLAFSHGRTAFKYGLKHINIKPKDVILIPDYICDVVIHPIKQLGIKYEFYSVNDDMSPDWKNLENKVNERTKALLMVHYFGQPQKIEQFEKFCKFHSLVLIEDNSHGHGGKYRDQLLGTFGKIGFSSPRKVLGVSTGGILYFNGSIKQSVNKLNLPKISIPLYKQYFQAISLKFPRLKSDFKSRFFPRPEFENPNSFREPMINDYFINDKSLQLINNVNWDKLSKDRRKIYYLWENLAFENGLEPAFQSLSSKSSPWCYPCYVKNPKDVISWFNWGWENGYKVFSWPTLPVEIINADSLAIERWKRLICFSTNNRIQHLDSIHIKSSMLT